ncbi:helix-turn-helix transcriptional regulator [Salana multivorans]
MATRRPAGPWADFAREVGIRVQRQRVARGWSQQALADAAGVGRYTVQKLEKGESAPGSAANPTLRTVMALAQVLGVTLDDLTPGPWPDLRAGASPDAGGDAAGSDVSQR